MNCIRLYKNDNTHKARLENPSNFAMMMPPLSVALVEEGTV